MTVETILDKVQFLDYGKTYEPCLKSYADTLWFYYLGYLSTIHSTGEILEIGVGGSTVPLRELAKNTNKKFYTIDIDPVRTEHYCKVTNLGDTQKIICASQEVDPNSLPLLCYAHIDGDKNITKPDLELMLANLSPMGIICQDDYGNNKHPMVTISVHRMIEEGKLVLLFVGDSSCWLVRKEDHYRWMDIFNNDFEFLLLSMLLNVRVCDLNRIPIECYPYVWMTAFAPTPRFSEEKKHSYRKYFEFLLSKQGPRYLKMPYTGQSEVGKFIKYDDVK